MTNDQTPPLPMTLEPSGPRLAAQASGVFVRTVGVLFVVFFIWANFTSLDRVTRGSGRVVAQEKNNLVQHLEGGIVAEVLVAEGEKVAEGDVLVRVENSLAEAELNSAELDLLVQRLTKVRLNAEATGAEDLVFTRRIRENHPAEVSQQMTLFTRAKAEKTQSLQNFDEQIAQKQFELSEREARYGNKKREAGLMLERLKSLRSLSEEGAIARNELLQNETLYQQMVSQLSDLEFQIKQTSSALSEVQGRRREAELALEAEAERALAETEVEIAKLTETVEALNDRQERSEVTAPTSGTINKLFVSNVSAVVRPGQAIAEIVADDASIAVEARLSPQDRARVWPGLRSIVKVSAYEFTTYGGLEGRVVEISPDALTDENGNIYFRIRIEADADAFGPNRPIVPGMLADVDIISGKRTVLQYIARPIQRVQERALKEG